MRVLHIHSGNLYGGVEAVLITLARHRQACLEMEPHFVLCFEGQLSKELRASGTQIHILPGVRLSRPASVWYARRKFAELLRQKHFDVVVCHSSWSQVIFGKLVRAASLPLVFWSHDAATGVHWLERWARCTPPDFAICNSKYTARALRTLYPKSPAKVIYCPVELPELSLYRMPELRSQIRDEFDTPRDDIVIIQVSRMESWKGHSLHLDALGLLKELPGWTCWFVGGAQRPGEIKYLKSIEAKAVRLGINGRVHFLGLRRDVPRLLVASDIFCQPNIQGEPFGIAFIEALAAGLPVITTKIGAAMEVIDESCGVLVPPFNPQALAIELQKTIESSSLRAKLGSRGPQRAKDLCDVKLRLRDIHEILAGVSQ